MPHAGGQRVCWREGLGRCSWEAVALPEKAWRKGCTGTAHKGLSWQDWPLREDLSGSLSWKWLVEETGQRGLGALERQERRPGTWGCLGGAQWDSGGRRVGASGSLVTDPVEQLGLSDPAGGRVLRLPKRKPAQLPLGSPPANMPSGPCSCGPHPLCTVCRRCTGTCSCSQSVGLGCPL